MKTIARSLIVVLVALISVPALAVSVTIATAVQLLAATALIMGGTQHPLSTPPDTPNGFINAYMAQAVNNFIIDSHDDDEEPVESDYNTYAVIYPAEFFPVFGAKTFDTSVGDGVANLGSCLDSSAAGCTHNEEPGIDSPAADPPVPGAGQQFAIFGYSQSAVVASLVKNGLIDGTLPNSDLDGTEFYLISNPMRPNGGILGRGFEGLTIPFIGITFYGPTENSCDGAVCAADDDFVLPTVDAAQQYDFLGGDAPARPFNLLAMVNSLAAYAQLHGDVPSRSLDGDDVIDQGQYGDTHYYMLASERLPILMPLRQIGVPEPILAFLDAPLRVMIEDAYVRDVSPGEHVPFRLSPIGNPVKLVVNLVKSIPVGIDDALQEAGIGRALGTADVHRPFGVGGPVYSKEPGHEWEELPAEDSNIQNTSPLASGKKTSPPATIATAAPIEQPQTGKQKLDEEQETVPDGQEPDLEGGQDADQIGNVTPENGSSPDGAKPQPILIRDSLNARPQQQPSATRPHFDGPLKRIFNALTGQRPKPAAETKPKDEPAKTEDAAA